MKTNYIIFFILLFSFTVHSQNVGIGTTNPNAKALLDISSTSKGFLPPRMTASQRIAINPAAPATGLIVYDTDSSALMLWNGSLWNKVVAESSNFWNTSGNITNAASVIGSINFDTLNLITKNVKAASFQYADYLGTTMPNVVFGSSHNIITSSKGSSILSGGISATLKNEINSSILSAIVTGQGNRLQDVSSSSIIGGSRNSIIHNGIGFINGSIIGGGESNGITSNRSFIGGGYNDSIKADYSSIVGGSNNIITSTGSGSIIGGGTSNRITAPFSSVSGGLGNHVYGDTSIIGGGLLNQVLHSNANAVLAGGNRNTISGAKANVISGGQQNLIDLGVNHAIIAGGLKNYIDGSTSVISGGQLDSTFASFSVIGGGNSNRIYADGYGSAIGGGTQNKIFDIHSTISGGWSNFIEGENNNISGGIADTIFSAKYSTINGGAQNIIHDNADSSVIGGGVGNYIVFNADGSVINGGIKNIVGEKYGAIVGGKNNFVEGQYSYNGGGQNNKVFYSSAYSTNSGGQDNIIDGSNHSSMIGGYRNYIDFNNYSTIGGGYKNYVGSPYSVIGGGDSNRVEVGILSSAIAGGKGNKIENQYSVIGGGLNNYSRGDYSAVLGGNTNEAGGEYSVVSGGAGNTAGDDYSAVIGGRFNDALGKYSVASGYKSKITHSSNFMFADFRGNGAEFNSKSTGQFMVRVSNGALFTDQDTSSTLRAHMHSRSNGVTPQYMADQVGDDFARIRLSSNNALSNYWDVAAKVSSNEFNIFRNGSGNVLSLTPLAVTNYMTMDNGARLTSGGAWTNASDRNVKDNFEDIDEQKVLEKLASLSIQKWHYKKEANGVNHIGPMAQDFHAIFALGDSDKSISTIDADGVNMAAIKALYAQLKEAQAEIQKLKEDLANLKK